MSGNDCFKLHVFIKEKCRKGGTFIFLFSVYLSSPTTVTEIQQHNTNNVYMSYNLTEYLVCGDNNFKCERMRKS